MWITYAFIWLLLAGMATSTVTFYDYIRPAMQCNKECATKTPVASVRACCKAQIDQRGSADLTGFCSGNNEAFCLSHHYEYIG